VRSTAFYEGRFGKGDDTTGEVRAARNRQSTSEVLY
jgi:hypothetical protein